MGKVVSINAFVVHVEVSVEMIMISVQANLVFGPFDTKEEASKFGDALELIHAKRHHDEVVIANEIFSDTGLPTRPYLDVHLGHCMSAEYAHARREAKSLISPGVPEETESKLGEYAVRAAFEATSYACALLDNKVAQ